jgi:diguanylate cyclase (GGDEF)-like protein
MAALRRSSGSAIGTDFSHDVHRARAESPRRAPAAKLVFDIDSNAGRSTGLRKKEVMAARSVFLVGFLAFLALLPGGAACQSVPILDGEGGAIGQCMERIRSIPERAAAVAQKRLDAGGLAPAQEIAWLGCRGMAASVLGRPAEAIAAAGRMQALLEAHWDVLTEGQRFDALRGSGDILQNSGEPVRAASLLGRAYGLALTQTSTLHRIYADETLAVAYLNLDAPDAAERHIAEARTLSEQRAPDQPFINYYYALTLTRLKRYDEALALYGQPEKHLHDILDAPVLRHRIDTQRAIILAGRGDRRAAQALLEASLAQQRAMRNARDETETQIQLARLEWADGAADAALASARQALARAEQGNFLKEKKDAWALLATIHAALGSPQEALEARTQANATARAMLEGESRLSRAIAEAAIRAHRDVADPAVRDGFAGTLRLLLAGLLATFAFAVAVAAWIHALRLRLRAEAARALDPLTGLPGRAAAMARFGAMAAATQVPHGVVLLVAVDRLDAIDDLYGYETGARVLRELAAQLRAACRPGDFVARWSDDGFLVAIDGITSEQAGERARRLCSTVEQGGIDLSDGDALKISISVGIASLPFFPQGSRADWHDSLRLAGRALQAARRAGTSAWASIRGLEAGGSRSTVTIAQAPRQAEESGLVQLDASSPLAWQA